MREAIQAVQSEWRAQIAVEYPNDVPSPHHSPRAGDAEYVAYTATKYLDLVEASLIPPTLGEAGTKAEPSDGVVRFEAGVHRAGALTHAGAEKVVNLHPVIMSTSESDARMAEKWALEQIAHYPREDNAASRLADTHGLIVRVEWGRSPKKPYEVDTEPSGLGMLMLLSPKARAKIIEHRASFGLPLWSAMPGHRVDDSMEHWGAPLVTTDELTGEPTDESGLLLPFMGSGSDLPEAWHPQSIFPVLHMEDKLHLVSMGLAKTTAEIKDWSALVERITKGGDPTMIRELIGSCATGMYLYAGAGDKKVRGGGFSSQAQVLKAIRAAGDDPLLWRPYELPGDADTYRIDLTNDEVEEFGTPDRLNAIRRYFVAISPDGNGGRKAECVGGFTTLRQGAKVHGANDAFFVIQDPPER